jgi:hypothetical protein
VLSRLPQKPGTVSKVLMTVEAVLSVVTLAGFIWVLRFLLPKAVTADDALALVSAILTVILALIAWLLIGVRTLR